MLLSIQQPNSKQLTCLHSCSSPSTHILPASCDSLFTNLPTHPGASPLNVLLKTVLALAGLPALLGALHAPDGPEQGGRPRGPGRDAELPKLAPLHRL